MLGAHSFTGSAGARKASAPPFQLKASSAGTVQMRGYDLKTVIAAAGGHAHETANGRQMSTPNQMAMEGIKWHFSIPKDNPHDMHLSFYPAEDADFNHKILDFRSQWNPQSESYGPVAQIFAQWKPYKKQFGAMKQFASARFQELGVAIKTLLDNPPQAQSNPSLGDDFISLQPYDDGMDIDLPNERYTHEPFPTGENEYETSKTLFFKKDPAALSKSTPIQRKATHIADDESTDEHMAIENSFEWLELSAPDNVKAAYRAITSHPTLQISIGFSDHVEGEEFGFSQIQGSTIAIHLSRELIPEDEELTETDLQATIFHEFILHIMPALPDLLASREPHPDELQEHTNLASWKTYLDTCQAVNGYVLFNAISDGFHHHHLFPTSQQSAFEGLLNSYPVDGMWINQLGGGVFGIGLGESLQNYFIRTPNGITSAPDLESESESDDGNMMLDEPPTHGNGDGFIPLPQEDPMSIDDLDDSQRYFGGPFPAENEYETFPWD